MKLFLVLVLNCCLALVPVAKGDARTDPGDDDDKMSGGELAALILLGAGAVAGILWADVHPPPSPLGPNPNPLPVKDAVPFYLRRPTTQSIPPTSSASITKVKAGSDLTRTGSNSNASAASGNNSDKNNQDNQKKRHSEKSSQQLVKSARSPVGKAKAHHEVQTSPGKSQRMQEETTQSTKRGGHFKTDSDSDRKRDEGKPH